MNDFYPLVYKPYKYELAEKAKPILPLPPTKPELPEKKKRSILHKIFLPTDDLFHDKIQYKKELDRYNLDLANFESEMGKYNEKIKMLLSETNISIYRNQEKVKSLFIEKHPLPSDRDVLKGRHEDYFLGFLKDKLSDKVYADLKINVGAGSDFFPDISYLDKDKKLCIDIEIDEPYSLTGKTPIHYKGVDDNRNNYFLSNGWFVVRFSEKQVAKQPRECCNFLLYFIDEIVGTTAQKYNDVSNSPFPDIVWTYDMANKYAISGYRNNY